MRDGLQLSDEEVQRSKVINEKNVYPGMMFSLAKKRVERTQLWQIVKRMPKGALLHAHLNAMVDLDFLFEMLLSTPDMHIYSETALASPQLRATSTFKFRFMKSINTHQNESRKYPKTGSDYIILNSAGSKTENREEVGSSPSIWFANYKPGTLIPVIQAADSFPNGGRPAFLKWLRVRCQITQQESIEHYNGVDDVWRKFLSIFPILDSMLFYEPIFRRCINRIFAQLHADGIRWVDFRLAFLFSYFQNDHNEPESDYGRMFQVFGEELEKFKATEAGRGFWGSRIIWTGIRALETRAIIEDMKACIKLKLAYPHLISGYDLVGQEDPGRPLKDFLPELFWFREQCTSRGIEIPFFFHAGECLGDGSETDQNLFDAILLGTRRIGHGFSLYKHPLLMDLVKEKKILVESCPISNEVLRLCSSVSAHPLPALLARGVSCSLSNDDPAILGHESIGSSHDFWQALQGWDNLGLPGLASLAENSVRWAAFEDQSAEAWLQDIQNGAQGTGLRATYLKKWHEEWEEFCLWVLTEFGLEAPSKSPMREMASA